MRNKASRVEDYVDPYGVLEHHPCPPRGPSIYSTSMEMTAVPAESKFSNVDVFSLCRYRCGALKAPLEGLPGALKALCGERWMGG